MKKHRLVIVVAGLSLVCVALIALRLGRPDSGTRQLKRLSMSAAVKKSRTSRGRCTFSIRAVTALTCLCSGQL